MAENPDENAQENQNNQNEILDNENNQIQTLPLDLSNPSSLLNTSKDLMHQKKIKQSSVIYNVIFKMLSKFIRRFFYKMSNIYKII